MEGTEEQNSRGRGITIEGISKRTEDIPLRKMDPSTRLVYIGLLILTTVTLVLGIMNNRFAEALIAVPIIILILMTMFRDKEVIHVPPVLILMVVTVMIIMTVAKYFRGESQIISIIGSFLTGMVLCIIGLIIAYMALGKAPGFANEKPGLIAIESFAFGLALFNIWMMIVFFLPEEIPGEGGDYRDLGFLIRMDVYVMLGCLLTAILFYEGNHNDFLRSIITRFLDKNSTLVGLETDLAEETEKMILSGESDRLEFKSTIHTNLNTGEKDKRMEKAVLKSIVAFLNTSGGTLLVGVDDEGKILGVEVQDYDNLDKMNLNITSLISSQIGDEFIPFIRFRDIIYGKREDGTDKVVVRFDCTPTLSPVFLKDGKVQTFFVRSGPSSVEISGIDLIKYVNNRSKAYKRKYSMARTGPQ
ncbi:MAG: ATP-binding protein [Candidatus Methanomethylophilaceae archaeon]|nr:ATP-binding protein [Candidatus Methanomethylophilaceae archaeon]